MLGQEFRVPGCSSERGLGQSLIRGRGPERRLGLGKMALAFEISPRLCQVPAKSLWKSRVVGGVAAKRLANREGPAEGLGGLGEPAQLGQQVAGVVVARGQVAPVLSGLGFGATSFA